jgi:hypothetical protein
LLILLLPFFPRKWSYDRWVGKIPSFRIASL